MGGPRSLAALGGAGRAPGRAAGGGASASPRRRRRARLWRVPARPPGAPGGSGRVGWKAPVLLFRLVGGTTPWAAGERRGAPESPYLGVGGQVWKSETPYWILSQKRWGEGKDVELEVEVTFGLFFGSLQRASGPLSCVPLAFLWPFGGLFGPFFPVGPCFFFLQF